MNAPALPAYLQSRNSRIVSDGAADGIGAQLPPHISIRGNEFTLIDASSNRQEVDEKYLDVCFVDRSDVICKQFYAEKWQDDSNDPPLCWSANGVAPSTEASQPQAATCAVCPNNVRGSATSAISGKAIKACRDEKWCAVILPKYPTMIFQFKITPGSFVAWKAYVDKFKGQATDLSDVVTRVAFEKGKNGVLTFEATAYIDQALYTAREAAALERKTDVLVGRLDKPIQGALAASRQEEARPTQPALTAGAPLASHGETGTPAVTAPAGGAFGAPQQAGDGKRRRRTKAEIEADNAKSNPAGAGQGGSAFGGGNGGPAPFRPSEPPAGSPAAGGAPFGIQEHAVAPDPAMTQMLGGIFGSPAKGG